MKKLAVFCAALCILTSAFNNYVCVDAYADEQISITDSAEENYGYKYQINGNEAEITYVDRDTVQLILPSEIDGVPVTKISNNALNYCDKLISISLPDSLREIGEYAFDNCTSLTEISFPDTLEYIGDAAFRNCTSLTSVYMPDSVTETGGAVFYGCNSLKSIRLSENIDSIPVLQTKGADYDGTVYTYYPYFQGCSSLINIDIPDNISEIPYMTFADCTSLETINTGNNTSIFKKCKIRKSAC